MKNTTLNTENLTKVSGGWPNGWDVAQTGPLASCDPLFETCDTLINRPPVNRPPVNFPPVQ